MKSMTFKYFILLSFLFCFSLFASSDQDFREARNKVVHQALGKFTKDMKAKGFNAAGIGESVDHDTGKYKLLRVIFDIDELPSIEFARRLEVETVQEFLKYINNQEGIQDYLVEYPFTFKFVQIDFISRCPEIGLSSVWCGYSEEIIYDKKDPDRLIAPSIEVHRESYEEALKILAQEDAPSACIISGLNKVF